MENTPSFEMLYILPPAQRRDIINRLTPEDRGKIFANAEDLFDPEVERSIQNVLENLGKPEAFNLKPEQEKELLDFILPLDALAPIVNSRTTRPEGFPFVMSIKDLVKVPAEKIAQLPGMNENKMRLLSIGLIAYGVTPINPNPQQPPSPSNN